MFVMIGLLTSGMHGNAEKVYEELSNHANISYHHNKYQLSTAQSSVVQVPKVGVHQSQFVKVNIVHVMLLLLLKIKLDKFLSIILHVMAAH